MGIKTNAQKQVTLQKNMHISQSAIIQKKMYDLPGNDSLKNAIIEISGNNLVIDFNGTVLDGSKNKYSPDVFTGIALRISDSRNITIKNAVIKGYKIALFAKNVQNLRIENCDFSYNFRQHLNSNRDREDLSDWQSYHHNEQDEWMRFGAGMYLRNCDSAFIKNNIVQNGQCGLMMTNCNAALIYNNNFSFNSGIGIGLYKSSNNRVMNNQLDWNIRGVSDGVYYRGQDAAAILVYEQSNENIFAWNSATHSGDGFFLWAGQTTMDSGTGGCNDNLIFQNDFSYAPTNGVEVTFSRNTIIGNTIFDCTYGVWGGYSYNSLIAANHFKNNTTGIGIEQGQENDIENNFFENGKTAIRLWATPGRKMEGKYDELRDVRSLKYGIKNNFFDSMQTVFDISHSESIRITGNKILHANENTRLDSTVKNIFIRGNGEKINFIPDTLLLEKTAPQKLPDARNAMLPADHLEGKKYMMMAEWGPYDFQSPILWLTKKDSFGNMHFEIYGPPGKWAINSSTGIENFSAKSGTVPGTLDVKKTDGDEISIELKYTGGAVTSPFGEKYAAGTPYVFSYKKMSIPIDWHVQLFTFDSSKDPIKKENAFYAMIKNSAPVKDSIFKNLENHFGKMQPKSSMALVAEGEAFFPKGNYTFGVSAGDLVRVYIDNKMVLDAWDSSKIIYDADYHHDFHFALEGKHSIKIIQAQYGDYGMLYFTIDRK